MGRVRMEAPTLGGDGGTYRREENIRDPQKSSDIGNCFNTIICVYTQICPNSRLDTLFQAHT